MSPRRVQDIPMDITVEEALKRGLVVRTEGYPTCMDQTEDYPRDDPDGDLETYLCRLEPGHEGPHLAFTLAAGEEFLRWGHRDVFETHPSSL